jgi:hypothetical protein
MESKRIWDQIPRTPSFTPQSGGELYPQRLKINFSYGKVIYDKNLYKHLASKIIKFFDTFDPEKFTGLRAYIDPAIIEDYEKILNLLFICVKQEYNSLENEFRFIIMSSRKHFRSKNSLIIPYIKLNLEVLPIEEIIIGPKISDELAENGLRQICHYNNIKDVKIKHSLLRIR